jgi:trehalose 6-phosphate phosphatase
LTWRETEGVALAEVTQDYDAPADVPRPDPSRTALFLDFDGTLALLAERPDGVVVDGELPQMLSRVAAAFDGGVTILTGRPVRDIETFLPGHVGTIIGGHGAEVRTDGVSRLHSFAEDPRLADMTRRAHVWAADRPGLLVEEKPTGLVVHWRHAPDRKDEVVAFMTDIVGGDGDLDLHAAKMAHEIRPADADKGSALRQALDGYPGMMAVMIGDDATDEPAMAAAVDSGGTAVKVGDGPTGAPWRLRDPAAVHALLRSWAQA